MILYSTCHACKKHLLNMFSLHLRSTLSSSFPHSTGTDQNQIQPLFPVTLAGRALLPWRDPLLSAQSVGIPSFICRFLRTMEYAGIEVEEVGSVFPIPEAPEVIFLRHLLQAALALHALPWSVHNRTHASGLSAPACFPYLFFSLLSWRTGSPKQMLADKPHAFVRGHPGARECCPGEPQHHPCRDATATFTASFNDCLCWRRSPLEMPSHVSFAGAVNLPPGWWLYCFG